MNLLQETKSVMKEHGLHSQDIVYIGTNPSAPAPHYSCSWRNFTKLANRKYDAGYGAQEVACDLVIIFKDGTWMERSEYDGSEDWEVHHPFILPTETLPIVGLFAKIGWDSLATIAGREGT